MTAEVQESCHIEVASKLDEASNWLNIEGTRYNGIKAKLKQVDSRCEILIKELNP